MAPNLTNFPSFAKPTEGRSSFAENTEDRATLSASEGRRQNEGELASVGSPSVDFPSTHEGARAHTATAMDLPSSPSAGGPALGLSDDGANSRSLLRGEGGPSTWFTAADIALALGAGWHKKKVHRLAERQKWVSRTVANRLEYQPPREIADIVLGAPTAERGEAAPVVRFADLVGGDEQREIVLLKEEACQLLANNLHLGKLCAVGLVVQHFKNQHPLFRISDRSLRWWHERYSRFGIDGLVEQKRGAVGRKSYASMLSTEDILGAAAAAIGHGAMEGRRARGVMNIARAYRNKIVANPELTGPVRAWCHGEHASKAYVPPSVREAIKNVAPQAVVTRLQIGPKAEKLDGPYTECKYDSIESRDAFTADDMTANVYVWVEWANEQGFLLIRPQILAAMHVSSMAWLRVNAVIRPKGQYNKDDVWGLIGGVLDDFGVFKTAILEGGTWQSGVVIGQKTNITDNERFGGLKALGVNVVHTRTPHGKIIETAFNQLQYEADNCRGFCGRMEMKDCPEATKAALRAVDRGEHPRHHFMHISEYAEHLQGCCNRLNNERHDGKLHKGATPWDVWSEHIAANPHEAVPDSHKWLYRSAYQIKQVTRNGVRIQVGTGKYAAFYNYDNEVLEVYRGRRVVIYWNDRNPDTDAVVFTVQNGRPHKFLCLAKRVRAIDRLGASVDEMENEARRKKLKQSLSVTMAKSLAPFMERTTPQPGAQAEVRRPSARPTSEPSVQARIDEAAAAQDAKDQTARVVRNEVRRAELQPSDMDALTERATTPEPADVTEEISTEEIAELFSSDSE